MKTTKKNGLTKAQLIIAVAVVVAILAATLIPTFISVANANSTIAQLEQKLEQLTQKINDQSKPLTLAEVEAKIAEKLAQLPDGVTAEEMSAAIADALADVQISGSGLSAEQVQAIVDEAIAGLAGTLTQAEIEKIVNDALADIEHPEAGPSIEEIEEMITDAITAAFGNAVTEDAMKAAIEKAVNEIFVSLREHYVTKDELEEIVKDILAEQDAAKEKVEVSNLTDLNTAISNPTVSEITFVENITLDVETVVDRDVVIDLNGYSLKAPKDLEYPASVMMTIGDDTEVTIKNGVFVDPTTNLNGGMDFFRVGENSVLTLENTSVAISVTAEVVFNDTLDRWQTNSATHRIFVLENNASVSLKDTDITVIAPKTVNFSSYARYNFNIIGIHFARNSTNAKFVMDGGSFTMQVTDPNASIGTYDYTDKLYFVKAERETGTLLAATNTLEIKGDAKVVVGGPNEDGELNSTNNLFYLGAGYNNGKTYYSGLKTFAVGADATIELNGVRYGMDADGAWELEKICQELGNGFANSHFDNAEEIEYHFACSNNGYGCTFEEDFTLAEVPAKCPECGKGSLVLG